MKNIGAFEILLCIAILWLGWLLVYIIDSNKSVINNKKRRENMGKGETPNKHWLIGIKECHTCLQLPFVALLVAFVGYYYSN
jgi:hypothetical protein